MTRKTTDPKTALRAWRERHGWSHDDLSRLLGPSARSFQRWETRTPEPNHGKAKLWPVPPWLELLVKQDADLDGKREG